jgi:hypothetical protein
MLNLLSWREERIQEGQRLMIAVCFLLIIVASLLILGYRQLLLHKLVKTTITKQKIIDRICSLKSKNQQQTKLIQGYMALDHDFHFLNRQIALISILKLIIHLLPSNSYLISLAFEENNVFLEGVLLSSKQNAITDLVQSIKRNLKSTPRLVRLTNTTFHKIEYKLAITLKR